jgi:hypothetical protein
LLYGFPQLRKLVGVNEATVPLHSEWAERLKFAHPPSPQAVARWAARRFCPSASKLSMTGKLSHAPTRTNPWTPLQFWTLFLTTKHLNSYGTPWCCRQSSATEEVVFNRWFTGNLQTQRRARWGGSPAVRLTDYTERGDSRFRPRQCRTIVRDGHRKPTTGPSSSLVGFDVRCRDEFFLLGHGVVTLRHFGWVFQGNHCRSCVRYRGRMGHMVQVSGSLEGFLGGCMSSIFDSSLCLFIRATEENVEVGWCVERSLHRLRTPLVQRWGVAVW